MISKALMLPTLDLLGTMPLAWAGTRWIARARGAFILDLRQNIVNHSPDLSFPNVL